LSEELGFSIPVVSRIPDSLSFVPDYKTQDSIFHKEKFLGFWNPDSLTWGQFVLNEVKIRMSHFASEKWWQSKMQHRKNDLNSSGEEQSIAEQ